MCGVAPSLGSPQSAGSNPAMNHIFFTFFQKFFNTFWFSNSKNKVFWQNFGFFDTRVFLWRNIRSPRVIGTTVSSQGFEIKVIQFQFYQDAQKVYTPKNLLKNLPINVSIRIFQLFGSSFLRRFSIFGSLSTNNFQTYFYEEFIDLWFPRWGNVRKFKKYWISKKLLLNFLRNHNVQLLHQRLIWIWKSLFWSYV